MCSVLTLFGGFSAQTHKDNVRVCVLDTYIYGMRMVADLVLLWVQESSHRVSGSNPRFDSASYP